MLLHMLFQISLLCKLGVAYSANERLLSKVHSCVVQKIPSLDELLCAAWVPSMDNPLTSPWALTWNEAHIIFIAFQNV